MTSKIDILEIFSDHISTLRDERTGNFSALDIIVFYAVPAFLGLYFSYYNISLSPTAIGIIVSAVSIFSGFLINVLVLLYTVREVGNSANEIEDQKKLIRQVNANLLYSITVSIISVITSCLYAKMEGIAERIFLFIFVFLLANYILTLFMCLKRIRVLLALRFDK